MARRNGSLAGEMKRGSATPIGFALAIVLLTIIAYWPVFGAGFIWDDDSYVTENALVQSVGGLGRIWIPRQTPQYYPVVFTSFWIEHKLWGLHPLGFHLVNVLLHALNALLVWRLCVMLKIPGAWLIGAVFAVHPIHVESVAWITERKNVLSGAFYLLAAITYLKFDDEHKRSAEASPRPRNWGHYFLSLVFFVLALLSKTVTCSLPAALILMMIWQRKKLTFARLMPLLPFFVIGFALAMHTAHLEAVHVGTWGPDFALDFWQRLMIASRALWFYPMKIVAPWPLIFIYPRWDVSMWTTVNIVALMGALVAAGACIVLFSRGRRAVPLAVAFYAGTIFPALGFINIYPMRFSFVADHFAYLASLGVIALVVGGLAPIFTNRRVGVALATGVISLLTTLTHLRAFAYESGEVLWRWTVQQNPGAWIAHNNLGRILLERNATDEAMERFASAVALRPDLHDLRANLANALRLGGRVEDSAAEFERIRLHQALLPRDEVRYAQSLAQLGRIADADAAFYRALTAAGAGDDARMLYGSFLAEQNRLDDAAAQFGTYLRTHSEDGFAHLLLGDAYQRQNRRDDAFAHWRTALGLAERAGDVALAQQARARLDESAHTTLPDR